MQHNDIFLDITCIARKVERPDYLDHGAVMESILTSCNAEKGQRASAGIIYGWLYDKITQDKFGGLVCEHYGNYDEKELNRLLEASLNELYVNGFDDRFYLRDIERITESFVPDKKYGTALVALCFTNYVYPIIEA